MSNKNSSKKSSINSKNDTCNLSYLNQSPLSNFLQDVNHDLELLKMHSSSPQTKIKEVSETCLLSYYLKLSLKNVDSQESSKYWVISPYTRKRNADIEKLNIGYLSLEKFNEVAVTNLRFSLKFDPNSNKYYLYRAESKSLLTPKDCDIESLTDTLINVPNKSVFIRGNPEVQKIRSGKVYCIILGKTYFAVYITADENSSAVTLHIHYLLTNILISQSVSSNDEQLLTIGRKQCSVNVDDSFISKKHGFFSFDKTSNDWSYCMNSQYTNHDTNKKLPRNGYWEEFTGENPLIITKAISLMQGSSLIKLDPYNTEDEPVSLSRDLCKEFEKES
mmetsp:Transcript_20681/g.21476  ORF Transcript_20681/g.21476 Transcript_20681/m.21476 type:complete len:333 (+) Transcript_20681:199-1197(+)